MHEQPAIVGESKSPTGQESHKQQKLTDGQVGVRHMPSNFPTKLSQSLTVKVFLNHCL